MSQDELHLLALLGSRKNIIYRQTLRDSKIRNIHAIISVYDEEVRYCYIRKMGSQTEAI